MTEALAAVAYLVLLIALVPRFLREADWTRRAPRTALAVWLATCVSAVAVAVLAGALLIMPLSTIGQFLVDLVEACSAWSAPNRATARPPVAILAGGGVLAAVLARIVYATVTVVVPQRRLRRAHLASLPLIARHDADLNVHIVDHPVPAAFCLPNTDGGLIVVSDGALRRLTGPQIVAVIAHERAHLRGRHHLITAATAVLAQAFPHLPLFVAARHETARLVEMAADDVAARRAAPSTVACALLDLARPSPSAPSVPSTLAMGEHSAADRARRLLGTREPLGRFARVLATAATAVLLLIPLAAPAVPALFGQVSHCPPPTTDLAPPTPPA